MAFRKTLLITFLFVFLFAFCSFARELTLGDGISFGSQYFPDGITSTNIPAYGYRTLFSFSDFSVGDTFSLTLLPNPYQLAINSSGNITPNLDFSTSLDTYSFTITGPSFSFLLRTYSGMPSGIDISQYLLIGSSLPPEEEYEFNHVVVDLQPGYSLYIPADGLSNDHKTSIDPAWWGVSEALIGITGEDLFNPTRERIFATPVNVTVDNNKGTTIDPLWEINRGHIPFKSMDLLMWNDYSNGIAIWDLLDPVSDAGKYVVVSNPAFKNYADLSNVNSDPIRVQFFLREEISYYLSEHTVSVDSQGNTIITVKPFATGDGYNIPTNPLAPDLQATDDEGNPLTDENGDPILVNQKPGGGNYSIFEQDASQGTVNIIQQFQQFIKSMLDNIIALIAPGIGAIQTLINAASGFFRGLSSLWSWLPEEVLSVISAGFIVCFLVAVFKFLR